MTRAVLLLPLALVLSGCTTSAEEPSPPLAPMFYTLTFESHMDRAIVATVFASPMVMNTPAGGKCDSGWGQARFEAGQNGSKSCTLDQWPLQHQDIFAAWWETNAKLPLADPVLRKDFDVDWPERVKAEPGHAFFHVHLDPDGTFRIDTRRE